MKYNLKRIANLIKASEGISLEAYLCPANIWTIGYGTIYHYSQQRRIKEHDKISLETAENFLFFEIEKNIIPKLNKIPGIESYSSTQVEALIDFAFNLGASFYGSSGFETITHCLKNFHNQIRPPKTLLDLNNKTLDNKKIIDIAKLNSISSDKYYSGEELIPYAFLLYRNPGSSFEEGLINRRIKEIDLWNQEKNMKNITAIKDTFLKKSPAQSSDLPPEDILDVELGKTYPIEKIIGTENGHKKIELGYGAGIWYIWPSHWDEWEIIQSESNKEIFPDSDEMDWEDFPNFDSIDWTNMSQPLGPYFTLGEYLQYDQRRIPQSKSVKLNSYKILLELHKIRCQWGRPIRITSGYRPEKINQAVGGVSNSRHISGDAVDISDAKGDTLKLQSWLDMRWAGALGYGASRRGFVHIDMRNSKGFYMNGASNRGARWTY